MTVTKTDAVLHTWSEIAADRPMANIERRAIVGQNMMVAKIHLTRGFYVGTHRHEGEQIAIVLAGKLRFDIGEPGSTHSIVVSGGQTIDLPPNVPHAVEALEDSDVLDLFSPVVEKMGVDMHG